MTDDRCFRDVSPRAVDAADEETVGHRSYLSRYELSARSVSPLYILADVKVSEIWPITEPLIAVGSDWTEQRLADNLLALFQRDERPIPHDLESLCVRQLFRIHGKIMPAAICFVFKKDNVSYRLVI